jgi:hypothetical protein
MNFLKQVINGFATFRLFLYTIEKSINTGAWDLSILIRQSFDLLFLFFGVFILFVIIRLGIKKIITVFK